MHRLIAASAGVLFLVTPVSAQNARTTVGQVGDWQIVYEENDGCSALRPAERARAGGVNAVVIAKERTVILALVTPSWSLPAQASYPITLRSGGVTLATRLLAHNGTAIIIPVAFAPSADSAANELVSSPELVAAIRRTGAVELEAEMATIQADYAGLDQAYPAIEACVQRYFPSNPFAPARTQGQDPAR